MDRLGLKTETSLVECASDRYFSEPIEVSSNDYKRERSGCELVILLKRKPRKRFLRVNTPVNCWVGFQEAKPSGMMSNMVLLEKKDINGMHTFLDFGTIDN